MRRHRHIHPEEVMNPDLLSEALLHRQHFDDYRVVLVCPISIRLITRMSATGESNRIGALYRQLAALTRNE